MLKYFVTLIICLEATIDLTLPHLEYIASHLELDECQKLIYALHYDSYALDLRIQTGETDLLKKTYKYIKTDNCLTMLLHWNQTPQEGFGQTHEKLERRLRQMGRTDLADWLGRSVFQELGKNLEQSLDDPFREILTVETSSLEEEELGNDVTESTSDQWWIFDTALLTGILILSGITFVLLLRIACLYCPCFTKRSRAGGTIRRKPRNSYVPVESEPGNSGSDAETELFNAYEHDPALTAMGL